MTTTAKKNLSFIRILVTVILIISVMIPLTGCFDKIETEWEFYSRYCESDPDRNLEKCDLCYRTPPTKIVFGSSSFKMEGFIGYKRGKWAKLSDEEYLLSLNSETIKVRVVGDWMYFNYDDCFWKFKKA